MTLPFWEASPELMPWAPPHCWVCLAGVSGNKKKYLGSSIIKTFYPALSAAIREQDGMDCSRCFWMTCSIYRSCHQLWASSLLGAFSSGFGWGKMYLESIILVIIYSTI